jgi:hypothetical protein
MVAPVVLAAAGSSLLSGLGGFLGNSAKKKQSKQIIRDYNDAETNSLAAYGGARDASLGYYQPFLQGGTQAFQGAQNMLQPGFQYSPSDPSYAWRFGEGMNALTRQQSASGALNSGGGQKAAMRFGQGLASTEFANDFARRNQLAQFGLQAAQGSSQAQDNFANGTYRTEFGAAEGRAKARGMRGDAIAGQFDSVTSGITGAVGSYFGF